MHLAFRLISEVGDVFGSLIFDHYCVFKTLKRRSTILRQKCLNNVHFTISGMEVKCAHEDSFAQLMPLCADMVI